MGEGGVTTATYCTERASTVLSLVHSTMAQQEGSKLSLVWLSHY